MEDIRRIHEEIMKMINKESEQLFESFVQKNPEILGASICTIEGLPLLTRVKAIMDEMHLSGIIAATNSSLATLLEIYGLGRLDVLTIKAENGYFYILPLFRDMALGIFATRQCLKKIRKFSQDFEKAVESIKD